MSRILLSYRRADTGIITGRIFDRLVQHFGKDSVFMDIDNIPFGLDFREHLNVQLAKCEIVVAVIGPDWLGAGEGDVTRIDDETDFVRIEVEAALNRNIPIIPLLVDRAPMPKASQLPESLKSFTFRNAAEVDTGRDFHSHMDRLIRAVDQLLGQPPEQNRSHTTSRDTSRDLKEKTKVVARLLAAFPPMRRWQGLWPHVLISSVAICGLSYLLGSNPAVSPTTLDRLIVLTLAAPLIAGFLLSLTGQRLLSQALKAGSAIAAIVAVSQLVFLWLVNQLGLGELAFAAAFSLWTFTTVIAGSLFGRAVLWPFVRKSS